MYSNTKVFFFPQLMHSNLFDTHIKISEGGQQMKKQLFIFLISCIFLVACGGNNASQNEVDYEKTKKMVVDILQTEDGKKALIEIMQDEKLKQELVIQSDVVKDAINEGLLSEKGKKKNVEKSF